MEGLMSPQPSLKTSDIFGAAEVSLLPSGDAVQMDWGVISSTKIKGRAAIITVNQLKHIHGAHPPAVYFHFVRFVLC